jgi:hypothetical protein
MAGSVRGSPGLMMLSLALAGRCWRTRYARARSDQSRTSRDLHDRHSTVSWPLYLAEHRSANVFLEVIVGVGGINPCFELGTIEHDDAKLTFGDARHFVKNGVSQ